MIAEAVRPGHDDDERIVHAHEHRIATVATAETERAHPGRLV